MRNPFHLASAEASLFPVQILSNVMYTPRIVKWLFFCKVLGRFQKPVKNLALRKSEVFWVFTFVVIHLLSFPHLLLIFSHQTLPTDHSIILTEVHRAAGCSDGAKDQNWPKILNPFTILGWGFLFLFPFLLMAESYGQVTVGSQYMDCILQAHC